MSNEIRYPSVEQAEQLHEQVLKMTGGERGRLSSSNLEYLLEAVRDIGERLDKKHALVRKATFLLHNIIVLHPFVNGNRRSAFELVRLFLRLNGYEFRAKSEDVYAFLLDIAASRVSVADVDEWIARNLTEYEGE